MSDLDEKILEFLQNTLQIENVEKNSALVDEGLIDSMQILELASFIEETCELSLVPDDMQVDPSVLTQVIESSSRLDPVYWALARILLLENSRG